MMVKYIGLTNLNGINQCVEYILWTCVSDVTKGCNKDGHPGQICHILPFRLTTG